MTRVAYISGDGIGPEIMSAARATIDAAGANLEWVELPAGESAIKEIGVCLKGPLATPVGKGFRSLNVTLRQEFELFAGLRPARSIPGVPCLYKNLDLVTVRENTQGLYSSMEHWVGEGHETAIGIGVNTRSAMKRIVRFAFEFARAKGRKKVTAVHKANILKIFSGLFLEVAQEIAKEYPDIEYEYKIVDAMAMLMVRDPYKFDVIVSTNLFGDILSDLAAGLIGGLGLAPGANLGKDIAIFEAVHGSAPDIAGKNIANPTSVILAGVMMLKHMHMVGEADRLEQALFKVIHEGKAVTADLNPKNGSSTSAMADAILQTLETQ